MKKNSKSKIAAPKIDPYLEGLMGKLLERLSSLERKMDVVIGQTAGRSSGPSVSGGSQQSQPRPQIPMSQPVKEYPRRERVMFEAICADCSEPCEVPFRPAEGRAIYCKECFAKRRSGGAGHSTPASHPAASSKPAEKSSSSPQATIVQAPGPRKPAKKSPATGKAKKKK